MKRIGLLGCGAIGQVHARNLAPHAKLVFSSRRRASAEEFHKRYGGVGACEGLDELLKADVEAVVIATPPELHREQVVRVLAAGKSVLVEKPMCVAPEEVEAIGSQLERQSEGFLMVAENYYYKPSLALMKEVIAWDGIGTVQRIAAKKLTRQSDEGWKRAHGALLEGGIHFIALVADLADTALAAASGGPTDGDEAQVRAPQEVEAEFPTMKGSGPERQSKVRLRWGGGIEAVLHYAWDHPSLFKGVLQHSTIQGDRGRILFESNGIYVRIKGSGRRGLTFPGFGDLMGYGAMTRDFLTCLEDKGRKPYSDFARARRDLGIAFKAYEGLASR